MRTASSKPQVNGDPASGLFGDDDTIDLLGVFGVLRRRKWLIGGGTLLGTLVALLVALQLAPSYTAKSSVMIEPHQAQVVNYQSVLSGLSTDPATVSTQVAVLQSRTFLSRVMDDLRLFDDPEFNLALVSNQAQQGGTLLAALTDPINNLMRVIPSQWLIATGLAKEPPPALESDAPQLGREAALTVFAGDLVVSNEPGSYLINVNFSSKDRQKAALIANRIAEMYSSDQLNKKLVATDRASDWLEGRLAELRKEVEQADHAVADYRANNNLFDAQGQLLNDQELSSINQQLTAARADLAEQQAKLRLVRELRDRGGQLDAIAEVAASPLITNLREQETQLLQKEADLRSLYGDKHPLMLNLKNEKAQLEAKIRAEILRITQTLDNNVRVAQARVDSLEGSMAGLKNRNTKDRDAEVKLAELQRNDDAARAMYDTFLQRYRETKQQEDIQQPDVRVVTVAAPPTAPSSLGWKVFTAAGFTASFVLSSVLALVLDRLDRGIRSSREVESMLGLQTLAMVPKLDRLKRNQKLHQYLREKPLSSYAEQIRAVFTALKSGAPGQPQPKVFLVTSSLPEEGKTALVVSLATLAARSNKKVLIIDLDLRHPSVHRELGWQVSAGIVEYMSNERSLEEVIHHDLETGLHFLPVKTQTTNPVDLIESERMRQLVDVCRANYDYVIIDSPPVASVADTKVAAPLADKVAFVVQWGKTVESAARDSLQALREAGIEPAGAVLTQIDLRKHAQYGYGDIGQYYSRSQRYYVN